MTVLRTYSTFQQSSLSVNFAFDVDMVRLSLLLLIARLVRTYVFVRTKVVWNIRNSRKQRSRYIEREKIYLGKGRTERNKRCKISGDATFPDGLIIGGARDLDRCEIAQCAESVRN